MTQTLQEDDQLLPDTVFDRSRRCAKSCKFRAGDDSAQMRTIVTRSVRRASSQQGGLLAIQAS